MFPLIYQTLEEVINMLQTQDLIYALTKSKPLHIIQALKS